MSSWTSFEASNGTKVETSSEPSFLDVKASELWLRSEPYFAPIGKEVRLSFERFREWWTGVALGHGPSDRVTAVGIGYAVVAFILLSYVHLLAVGNKETGKAVKNLLRQHVLVLKVGSCLCYVLNAHVTFIGCCVHSD